VLLLKLELIVLYPHTFLPAHRNRLLKVNKRQRPVIETVGGLPLQRVTARESDRLGQVRTSGAVQSEAGIAASDALQRKAYPSVTITSDNGRLPIIEEESRAFEIEEEILVFGPYLLRCKPNYQIGRSVRRCCYAVVNDQHYVAVPRAPNADISEEHHVAGCLEDLIPRRSD
jgi:hypothetical protein